MNQIKKLYLSDSLGASASILCAIHCAATPLLFLAKPILDGAESHGGFSLWGALDWVFLVLSFGAVWYSAKYTTHKSVPMLLWIFWATFAIGILSEAAGIGALSWLVYFGSIALAITHIVNFRYSRSCAHELGA